VSIKPLPPEAIETFSILLHPKRKYSARAREIIPNSSSSWSPKDASVPLLAWYRADTAHDAGLGQVDVWPDQSGVGDANRNQTRTASAAVTLNAADASYGGKPTVSFATGHLQCGGAWSTALAAPISILIIGESSLAGSQALISDGAGVNMIWDNGSNEVFYQGASNSPTAPRATSPSAVLFSDDGSGSASAAKLFVNDLTTPGGTDSSRFVAPGGSPGNRLNIAHGVAGVSDPIGKIAEVMVFAGILTPTDKANLKTYLNSTRAYGIPVT